MKYCDSKKPQETRTMDEGKNPNPRIYQKSEAGELIQEHSDFIEQMTDELQHGDPTTEALVAKLTKLIANTLGLKAALENDTHVDMSTASISFNDAAWEFYQIVREKSYIRKQERSATISRSGMFPSSHSSRDDEDMDVQQEYDDDYWDNPYNDSPKRGDYDHQEEAS